MSMYYIKYNGFLDFMYIVHTMNIILLTELQHIMLRQKGVKFNLEKKKRSLIKD